MCHRPPPCDGTPTRGDPALRRGPPPRAGRAGMRGGSVPTSASGRTWVTPRRRWLPPSTPWRRCRAPASPGSRGCTSRRPSASSTSPSSETPPWPSTCRPARTRRRRHWPSCWPSRAWSARSGAARAPAGGHASSTSTCWSSAATRCGSSDPRRPAATTRRSRTVGGCRFRTPAPGSASSCWRRWPTWRPACGRRAGARRLRSARARAEIAEGPGAARPVAAWDRRIGAWRAA